MHILPIFGERLHPIFITNLLKRVGCTLTHPNPIALIDDLCAVDTSKHWASCVTLGSPPKRLLAVSEGVLVTVIDNVQNAFTGSSEKLGSLDVDYHIRDTLRITPRRKRSVSGSVSKSCFIELLPFIGAVYRSAARTRCLKTGQLTASSVASSSDISHPVRVGLQELLLTSSLLLLLLFTS